MSNTYFFLLLSFCCFLFHGHAAFADPAEASIPSSAFLRRPSGTVIINQVNAQISITSNLPKARWTLMKNNSPVFEGSGSIFNLQTIGGNGYRIVPEEVEGYMVRVSPSSIFSLLPGQTLNASIVYERGLGYLTIQSPFPDKETLVLVLKPEEGPPVTFKIKSQGGKIFWQSPPLATGVYEVLYQLPPNYAAIPVEPILVKKGAKLQLFPRLFVKGVLRVIANVPEAIYLLRTLNGANVWKGEGREYTFMDVPSGTYLLNFSTNAPDYFIPPKEMKLTLNEKETKEIKVLFQLASKLMIRTNIDKSHVLIQEMGGQKKTYEESILNHTAAFNLPEGRYKITLSAQPEDVGTTANLIPPDPIEITLKALDSQDLNLSFRVKTLPAEKQRRLNVVTGVSGAGFSVYKLIKEKKQLIGHYTGKNVQVTLPSTDRYEIIFDEVPNYKSPESIIVDIKAGELKNLQIDYLPVVSIAAVPEGEAIIGDASSEEKINELPAKIVTISSFFIGIYEVTNAEFVAWLNAAIKKEFIFYIKEADRRGQIVNKKGELLFKTFEADSYSQISAQLQSTDIPFFMPLAGKDSHPVINVTWYGAMEYCKANEFRLPTEAEWEKAAGMELQTKGAPLKKYRYGFSKDEIDPTWANYKENNHRLQHFQVLTTPVGFYNGINSLPLKADENKQRQTHLAKSPYGAFDMSGNVWEWTADWYDENYYANMPEVDPQGPLTGTKKVVKGGCYDSLADGVRVSERMGLPSDYCDAYTGFRVAK